MVWYSQTRRSIDLLAPPDSSDLSSPFKLRLPRPGNLEPPLKQTPRSTYCRLEKTHTLRGRPSYELRARGLELGELKKKLT
jgi:hypothetical protein